MRQALRPFQADPASAGLHLSCEARWNAGVLALHFSLGGSLRDLQLPALNPQPQRRDGLWQSTCFEAFLARPGDQGYWELNLAPSGDWNVYRLSGYRQGLQAEQRISGLPFQQRLHGQAGGEQQVELELLLDLRALVGDVDQLQLSATAVLDHQQHGCSYWAWRHSGSEPDFHRRESFLLL